MVEMRCLPSCVEGLVVVALKPWGGGAARGEW